MKLSVLQENLYKSLQDISKFVPTKPQLPILSTLLIEAGEGQLTLYATDLHTGMKTSIGGKVSESGRIAIPSRVFVEYIASLQAGLIELETSEDGITVKGERSRATFQTSAAEDYPPFPKYGGKGISFSKEEFVSLVECGGMAAGIDESRPILSSVLIDMKGSEISAVSTDGYRLSKKKMARKEGGGDQQVLLPAKSLKEVTRIIAKGDAKKVEIILSDELRQASIVAGDSVFLLRVIDGSFPDYHAIVPDTFSEEISFDREEALVNLRRAMIFSRESSSIVKLTLGKTELGFLSSSSAVGEQSGNIPAKLERGEGKEIAFNGKYLQDFLSMAGEESIHFFMNESLKPGKFMIEKDDSFYYIVMPFRLQNPEQE